MLDLCFRMELIKYFIVVDLLELVIWSFFMVKEKVQKFKMEAIGAPEQTV